VAQPLDRVCIEPAAQGEEEESGVSSHPALLIIDVQKAIDDPSWGSDRNNPDAEINIGKLLAFWRGRSWPIFHVRHVSREPNSTYRPGQPGAEFKPEVRPQAGEAIIEKSVNSAFIGTDLEAELHKREIDTLVITGVITNNSVEATARMAGNLGFVTFVVADATATFGRHDFAGRWRTADEVHAMSLANLDGEYAIVITTAELLSRLA
jgi:nicotinamidase-related amidase